MPRQIIDTESSRGRLVRRRILLLVVVVLLALALLAFAWMGVHHGEVGAP